MTSHPAIKTGPDSKVVQSRFGSLTDGVSFFPFQIPSHKNVQAIASACLRKEIQSSRKVVGQSMYAVVKRPGYATKVHFWWQSR